MPSQDRQRKGIRVADADTLRELVSVRTLSGMLDIPEGTLRDMVLKRRLPYHKIGRLVRFNVGEIRSLYRAHRVEALEADVRRANIG